VVADPVQVLPGYQGVSQRRASWSWPAGVGDDPVVVTVDPTVDQVPVVP